MRSVLRRLRPGRAVAIADALTGAASPDAANPFATIADLPPDELTVDELAALTGAAAPSATNVYATMADLAAICTIQTGAPDTTLISPLVFDDTPTTGGLYVWTGAAYSRIGLATS